MTEIEHVARAKASRDQAVGIVVTDPQQSDNPITYANIGFARITGYDPAEVIGRNCRFLQGEETDQDAIQEIRDAVDSASEIEVGLVNYRKTGEPFFNRLLIAPIRDGAGKLTAFIAVQREERAPEDPAPPSDAAEMRAALPMLQELQHRVKNHLSMVVSMIRMQAGRGVDADAFKSLSHRIEALALLYSDLERAEAPNSTARIGACAYLTRVAQAIHGLEARDGVELDVECDEASLPVDTCAQLGLLVSELVTNALKHAFEGRERGKIWLRVHALSDDAIRLIVEDDGVGIPEDVDWPRDSEKIAEIASGEQRPRKTAGGVGGSIVRALTSSLDADINVMTSLQGTTVTIDMRPGG